MQNKGQLGMICGIVSIALSIISCFLPGSLGIVAVIMIVVALAAGILGIIFGVQGRKAGDSKGTAGLVTGIIGTVLSGIVFACVGCAALCVACACAGAGSELDALNELANELESLESLN